MASFMAAAPTHLPATGDKPCDRNPLHCGSGSPVGHQDAAPHLHCRADRVLKKYPRHLPDRKIILICRKGGLPVRADPATHLASPPGQDHGPVRTRHPSATQAFARPCGCEAPAGGGSGAGRGLWPPAGQGARRALAWGDGPCHTARGAGGRLSCVPFRQPLRSARLEDWFPQSFLADGAHRHPTQFRTRSGLLPMRLSNALRRTWRNARSISP
jgi:hypothetical protein